MLWYTSTKTALALQTLQKITANSATAGKLFANFDLLCLGMKNLGVASYNFGLICFNKRISQN
jgi:hypothetical protein